MPSPADYDNEESWMAACVPAVMDEGKPNDQAVAQCMQMWRDRDKAARLAHPPKPAVIGTVKNLEAALVDRAWSTLTIKSVDAENREIEGIATTPEVDRIGDIVEPLGGKFTLPLPLLWQHRHDEPVGHVTVAKTSKDGIWIKAKFARIDEPGELKNLVDKAWQAVKAGLVRGLSIGFKTRAAEPLDPNDPWGGLRFLAWDLLELSLVTIPANQSATINIIKSLDQGLLAATGKTETAVARQSDSSRGGNRPGVSGKTSATSIRKERSKMVKQTLAEQVSTFEAARAAKAARMADLMDDAAEKGETLDDAQTEEYDGLDREVKSIDAHLKRLHALEKANVAEAKPVTEVKTVEDGAAARGGTVRVVGPQLPPGIRFARMVKALGVANGDRAQAARIVERAYPEDRGVQTILNAAAQYGETSTHMLERAVVNAATTANSAWAGALVGDETGVFAEFLEWLRPQTILGKFGTNGVPALGRVPFRTPIITQTSGGNAWWVGEARAKPLTQFNFSRTTLEPLKAANIAVCTMELLRDSSPSADTIVRDQLGAALRERLDRDFINPTKSAVAGISPASITNGISAIASGGNTADDIREDVRRVMATFIAASNAPTSGVWVMPATTALALSMMTNELGQSEFPGLTMNGGTFLGLPVITSEFVPSVGSPVSAYVVLVNASQVLLADEGGIRIDVSREASLEMSDAPAHTAGGFGSPDNAAGASLVSMFQTNSIAFLAERTVNWMRARDTAVAVLSGVAWGTP